MLCKVCKSIDFGDLCYRWLQYASAPLTAKPEFQHHTNYKKLIESAQEDCELCIEVKEGARRVSTDAARSRKRNLTISCGPGYYSKPISQTKDVFTKGIAEIWFEWTYYKNEGSAGHVFCSVVRIFCEKESPAAALNIVSGRPIPTTPFSSESFETARTWLRDCHRNHKNSCPSKRAALLPSRVIDVGSGNYLGTPHLHISEDGEMGNWATLSHCWGQVGGYVTNVANLDRRIRSISMQELPPTLKDAIKVTRCMGLKYLWIDSICILQGSDVAAQADWLSESSRMRDYYKHCDFCIAADDASSDKIGFLRILRTQRAKVSISMPLAHWRRAGSCTIYLQADLHPRSAYPGRRRPILATRGWTLQEHVLSPRALHYNHEQLVWNCQFQKLSESNVNPEILSSSDRPWHGMDAKRFFLTPIHGEEYIYDNFGPPYARLLNIQQRWYSLVNDYAARALTFETDRLFALAGLVQEIEAQSGFTYWVGIWAEDAHAGLLWRITGRVNIPAAYIAPSWSWASLDISHYNDSYDHGFYPVGGWKLDSSKFKANISSCEIITVNGIPNGHLLTAKLTLHTHCLHLSQWGLLNDVAIATPATVLPSIARRREILLKFDVEPLDIIYWPSQPLLSPPPQVSALQPKAKGVLRWVSPCIHFFYSLVEKWKTHAVPFSQKPAQGSSPNIAFANCHLVTRDLKHVVQRLSTIQRNSNNLIIVRIASISDSTVRSCGRMRRDKCHYGSTMCLLVEPGTEEGTFRRVGLAQISNVEYGDSLPWKMRTIVLV